MHSPDSQDLFFRFSKALDQSILLGNSVLSEHTLYLVERHWGYANTAFTLYDNNRYYHTIGHNFTTALVDRYNKGLYAKDPVSCYIASTPSLFNPSQIKTVRSTDIFKRSETNQDDVKEYLEFLKQANLQFQLVAPVQDYRFVVYKNIEEQDFTEQEAQLISQIADIIFTKYQIDVKQKNSLVIKDLRDWVLANHFIGFAILNNMLELVDYNETFLSFVRPQADRASATSYLSTLLAQHTQSTDHQADSIITNSDFFLPGVSVHLTQRALSREKDFPGASGKFYVFTARRTAEGAGRNIPDPARTFAAKYALSPREMEIVGCMAKGLKTEDIASTLSISANTVRTHTKNIYAKMNINSQRALLALYNLDTHKR